MTEQFQKTVVEVVERILRAARADERLLSGLRLCAQEVLTLESDAAPSPLPVEEPTPPVAFEKPVVAPAPALPSKPRPLAEPFTLAGAQARLSLKAEAARWASERSRLLAGGADLRLEIVPQDQEYIRRGREEECYLWMLAPKGRRPSGPDQFDLIAAWYDNLADALALVERVAEAVGWDAEEITHALELVGSAQSALRVAVADCEGYGDEDQQAVFEWLRAVAADLGIYIGRGMKLLDPTDPSESAAVAGRIHAAASAFDERHRQAAKRRKLLAKARHKASVVAALPSAPTEAWDELMAAVDELVRAGVPASNKELREALLPTLGGLPAHVVVTEGFRLAVREIEKVGRGGPNVEAPADQTEHDPVVREARLLLGGRSAVLIGGDERRESKGALERALGLKDLVWIGTNKHDSYKPFESVIARPDVAVVLLAIRWSSHSYGEVSGSCDAHGKQLVRLPGGYSPNQVAHQIVAQAGQRLKAGQSS